MGAEITDRRLRKDAQRNRDGIFESAERVFARAGLDATVEEIAADAGVGVGTVYRRFGSKAGLIDALFADRMAEVGSLIRECAAAPSGREALESVLRVFVELQTRSRAIQQLMFTDVEHQAARLRSEVEPLLTAIVQRARSEGAVRADFAATDIPLLTRAASLVAEGMPDGGRELSHRFLELMIKGIADTPDGVAVPQPLPDSRFPEWLAAISSRG